MRVTIAFRNEDYRRTEYFLQQYYKSKSGMAVLMKNAAYEIAAKAAQAELDDTREQDK